MTAQAKAHPKGKARKIASSSDLFHHALAGLEESVVRRLNSIFKPTSNGDLRDAVRLWFDNQDQASQQHGKISTWDTSLITDMLSLFDVDVNPGAASFNEAIVRGLFIGIV